MTWWGLGEGLKKIRWESLKFTAWCSTSFKYKCSKIHCWLLLFFRSLILYCNGPPCVVQDTLANFLSQFKNYDWGKSKVLMWKFCVVVQSVLKISCPYQMAWIYESFISQLFLINLFFFCLLLFKMQATKKQSNETEVEVRFLLSEPHFIIYVFVVFLNLKLYQSFETSYCNC